MARKDRRGHGDPPADPFGTNDPAWEVYEPNVNRLRRWKPSIGRWRDRRPGELVSFMVVGGLAVLLAAAVLTFVFWAVGAVLEP
ncbi:MAG: hypothetical protein ACRDHV_08125 [Actinomycetota bacterium]